MKKETIINIIREDDTLHLMNDLKNNSKEELNELSNDGETFPLLFAIKKDESEHFIATPEVLDKLDVNMTNKHGTTALMELAKYGKVEEAQTLLEAGADMTLKEENGKTALYYAQEVFDNLNENEDSWIAYIFERWEKEHLKD